MKGPKPAQDKAKAPGSVNSCEDSCCAESKPKPKEDNCSCCGEEAAVEDDGDSSCQEDCCGKKAAPQKSAGSSRNPEVISGKKESPGDTCKSGCCSSGSA